MGLLDRIPEFKYARKYGRETPEQRRDSFAQILETNIANLPPGKRTDLIQRARALVSLMAISPYYRGLVAREAEGTLRSSELKPIAAAMIKQRAENPESILELQYYFARLAIQQDIDPAGAFTLQGAKAIEENVMEDKSACISLLNVSPSAWRESFDQHYRSLISEG